MGIHDRPYIRDVRGASGYGRPSLRMFTVNTWLIVICVAVFVIDGFLPPRWVPIGPVKHNPKFAGSTPTLVWQEERSEVPRMRRDGREYREVAVRRVGLEPQSGEVAAIQEMRPMHLIESWLHFSTSNLIFKLEYWRLLGFQFLHDHSSIAHILFNMMGLWFFGPIVEQRLGGKRYLAFYLLCGICGALMYLLLNLLGYMWVEVFQVGNRVPFLLFNDITTPLIGASAGIYGVLIAGASLAPDTRVYLFFVLPIRFATLAYVLVIVSVASLAFPSSSAGGEAAHLGGALAGFYFIRRQHHLHGFFDLLGRVDPTSKSNRARRTGQPGRAASTGGAGLSAKEIDRILEKIKVSGMGSLTEGERRLLRDASGR